MMKRTVRLALVLAHAACGAAALCVGEYYYGSTGLEHGLTIGRIRQIRVKIIKGIHALVIMEKLILQNPVG